MNPNHATIGGSQIMERALRHIEEEAPWRGLEWVMARVRKALLDLKVVPGTATMGQNTRRWRHVKRGTIYTEIGRAELQAARDVIEGMTFVIYRAEDGKLWVRQEDEFEDGRFEEVS